MLSNFLIPFLVTYITFTELTVSKFVSAFSLATTKSCKYLIVFSAKVFSISKGLLSEPLQVPLKNPKLTSYPCLAIKLPSVLTA